MKHLFIIAAASLSACLAACSCNVDNPVEAGPEDNLPSEASGIWMMDSLEDIDTYSSSAPCNRKTVRLLRNESENIQLVFQTEGNQVLDIVREGTPSAIGFDCRKVVSFENLKNDVLVPCGEKIKPENKLVKVWLSFKAGPETATGTYREIIRFRTSAKEYAVLVYVVVENAAIPETPTLPSVFGINPDNFIMTGLSEEEKMLKRKEVADLLLGYRISPYFSTWLSGTMKTECFSSPFPWNDDRSWSYLRNPGFSRIALPYHNLSDEELKTMLDRALSEGLMDKAYFYVWDEPTKPSEYEQIHAMADRLHGFAPSAKILTSFYCGPVEGEHKDDLFAVFDLLNGATGIFCTGVWSLQCNENRSAMCRAKLREGQEWWSYVCMSDFPGLAQNSSGIPNRVVMWRHWKEQTSGFLYWVVNSFGSMTPLKPRSGLPEGDGILVYPGEPFGVDKPCVSIRLERWRDGAEDYEMLVMYEKKKGRAAAEKLLSNVYTNPAKFTDNIKYVSALRKNLIEGILA